jgi:hypothetical protein
MLELFVVVCQTDCPKVYEIKETLWALLVVLWAIYFFFRYALRNGAISDVPDFTAA